MTIYAVCKFNSGSCSYVPRHFFLSRFKANDYMRQQQDANPSNYYSINEIYVED